MYSLNAMACDEELLYAYGEHGVPGLLSTEYLGWVSTEYLDWVSTEYLGWVSTENLGL